MGGPIFISRFTKLTCTHARGFMGTLYCLQNHEPQLSKQFFNPAVYHPAVGFSHHVKVLLSQFYFVYAANSNLFQQRHLTRQNYLAEQRAGQKAAEKDLFPVNVIDISLRRRIPLSFVSHV